MTKRFGDLVPGDVFYFAVDGEAVPGTPRYLVVEHGLAYKWFPEGVEGGVPRRIGPELEVSHVAHIALSIGRELGQFPPALPPDARAANDPLPHEEMRA